MTVRPATGADVAAICRVCADGWRDTYDGLYPPDEVERLIAEFYVPERVAREVRPSDDGVSWQGYLVAEDADSEVIAAAGGGLIETGVGELFVLYADPPHRREGAGRELLAAVTAQQTAAGASEQWVSVEPDNHKGIPFYEAMGFEPRGRRAAFGSLGRESLRMWRAV